MLFKISKCDKEWCIFVYGFSGEEQLLVHLIEDYLLAELPDGLLIFDGMVNCEGKGEYYVCKIS